MSEDRRLVKLAEAQKALQEAKTIPEVKNIIDKAEAIRHFVQQQGYALDIQNDATEISLRALPTLALIIQSNFLAGLRLISEDYLEKSKSCETPPLNVVANRYVQKST